MYTNQVHTNAELPGEQYAYPSVLASGYQ
jgi:hypothetical protein